MVLVVFNYKSKFVKIDCDLFSLNHKVIEHDLYLENYKNILPKMIKSKVIVFWFLSFKTLPLIILAKILGKRICVLSGGYDISNIKGYGMFSNNFNKFFQKIQFSLSSIVMVNSLSSYNELLQRMPSLINKLFWQYHALALNPIKINSEKRNIDFITIGTLKKVNMKRKGIETFIDYAKKYTDKVFYLVGPIIDKELLSLFPKNVKVTGFIDEIEKNKLLLNSKYYLQDSEHEGFGLSVLEAQLYGCHILYNPVYALNEVVLNGTKMTENFKYDNHYTGNNILKELNQKFCIVKRRYALEAMINTHF